MSRASDEILDRLHAMVATELLDVIENGVPVFDSEGVETGREPASAAYFAQAIKLLKDNGIEAIPQKGSPLGNLKDQLPQFTDEESAEDLPTRMN